MPLTREVASGLVTELRAQMERCPACFGIGKVRFYQESAFQSHFCLVCEEAAKSLYLVERDDSQGLADLNNAKVQEILGVIYARLALVAREFAKRCPGCFGVRRVWAGDQARQCLVCSRLHAAIDAYEETCLDKVSPIVYTCKEGRRL